MTLPTSFTDDDSVHPEIVEMMRMLDDECDDREREAIVEPLLPLCLNTNFEVTSRSESRHAQIAETLSNGLAKTITDKGTMHHTAMMAELPQAIRAACKIAHESNGTATLLPPF